LCEAMCADEATVIWFTAGRPVRLFPCDFREIGSSTVPELYGYISVQSSIKRALLQSSFDSVPALHFRAPRLPTWVSALVSTSLRHSQCAALPRLCWRGHRCSQPFGDFRNVACELVSSRNRVQDSFLVQGFDHLVQPSGFISLVPPMPLSIPTLTCKQVATYEHLDSDVLLHTRVLPFGSVISLSNGPLPSSSSLLLQVHPTPARTVTCSRTLMTFPPSRFHLLRGEGFCGTDARLQRISDDGLGCFVAEASDLPELFGPS
jgi:hypothetical protein